MGGEGVSRGEDNEKKERIISDQEVINAIQLKEGEEDPMESPEVRELYGKWQDQEIAKVEPTQTFQLDLELRIVGLFLAADRKIDALEMLEGTEGTSGTSDDTSILRQAHEAGLEEYFQRAEEMIRQIKSAQEDKGEET